MAWEQIAADLLAAANTAALTAPVARSVVAPGSGVARDCRMLAVWLDSIELLPTSPGELPALRCAMLPVINLRLLFNADCVPMPSDGGSPPSADKVTAWTMEFLADVEAIWNAVADAAAAGDFGECGTVSIGQSDHLGPLGGHARVIIPVRIAPL